MRIRKLQDGTIFIPRRDAGLEAALDAKYVRVPNQLRWVKASNHRKIDELAPLFEGKKCYIVGKGPSLNNLPQFDAGCPLLAIIVAVKYVDGAIGIAQDSHLQDSLECGKPMIVGPGLRHWYPDAYIFYHEYFGIPKPTITAICAIGIAQKYKATKLCFVAFDACTSGNTDYDFRIGYEPIRGGKPSRFVRFCKRIREACRLPYVFM